MSSAATGHLLEPIRDLGWQLDLAAELEEYLQAIQADESQLVNFAQAALLVQNSTVRYSKKVENLYSLVLEALSQFQSSKANQHASKRQKTPHGSNARRGSFDDTLALAMSDIHASDVVDWVFHRKVEESDKINLLPNTQMLPAAAKRITTKTFQASMALMGSLVPDDRETGESFKLRSCTLHSKSGALLLDDSSKLLLDPDAQVPIVELPAETQANRSFRQIALGHISEEEEENNANDHSFGGGDDDDNGYAPEDNNEPDFAMDMTSFEAMPSKLNTSVYEEEIPVPKKEQIKAEIKADPWQLLDPYDATHSVSAPFCKGIPYQTKLPKVKAEPVFKDEPLYAPTAKKAQRTAERLKRHLKSKPYTFFAKDDCEAFPFRRLSVQYASAIKRTEELSSVKKEPKFVECEEVLVEEENEDIPYPQDDYGFDGGASDSGGEEQVESIALPAPITEYAPPTYDQDELFPTQQEATDTVSYEELCKQHFEQFLQGSEHYVQQTDLTRKVNEWQRVLTPILRQQEERPSFDIHACGDTMLNGIREQESKPFEAIVHGMNVYQVCRMFSAALHLANTGSVQLDHTTALDSLQIIRNE
ncbi:condensin-2 complex subunit H2 [Thraustotheca clavata]|uniref:Condensin-2 complex subunit H2 n=1 Tax=Thraustotheca clavata TaxID=74557 RepID=A0A1V9Y6W1_9STRA|nr:condensin-2 complex subunit H2 [Thraustotheca clavata]